MSDANEKKLAAALCALTETPAVDSFIAFCAKSVDGDLPPTFLAFPKFREDSPDIVAFVEQLWLQAINYVIPLRKRRQANLSASKSTTGGDLSASVRLIGEAKRAFIRYKESNPSRASEVGELLAYLLALKFLNAAQVVSKMALKTNPNMPVFGLDGVHASFKDGIMTLFFLESKMAPSAAVGAAAYAESTAGFGTSRKNYLVEYEILSDLGNLEALGDEDRAAAMDYLDIYGSKKDKRLERSVGVICYSEQKHYANKLQKSGNTPPSKHEEHFLQLYATELEHHRKIALKHLSENDINPAECCVFFFAVPDVDEIRKLFDGYLE